MKNNKIQALENLQQVYKAEIKMAKDDVKYWDNSKNPIPARIAEQKQVTYEKVYEDIECVMKECKHENSVLFIQNVNSLLFDFWVYIRGGLQETSEKEVKQGITDFLVNYNLKKII